MYSSKDLERLWFLYKTEGEPKGVSINSFCVSTMFLTPFSMTGIRKPRRKPSQLKLSVSPLPWKKKNLVRQS